MTITIELAVGGISGAYWRHSISFLPIVLQYILGANEGQKGYTAQLHKMQADADMYKEMYAKVRLART